MGVETAFQQMLILFFGILVGFAAYRMKIIDEEGSKAIVKLVMNVTLPLFIFSSGLTSKQTITGSSMLFYFGLALASYAIAYVVGLILSRLPLFEKKDRRLCSFMTTFGNTGFMGLPIIGALFGSEAVFYATIFNLPFNFLVFSIGIILVSDEADVSKIKPKMFVNSCLVASIAAIAVYLAGIELPSLATSCLDTVGAATVPLAMIITGASLGKETPRNVFCNAGLYVIALAKTLVVPAATYGLLSFFLNDPMLVKVGTTLMAMPVATNATLLCMQYGGNDRMASRGIFLSTLLAVVTIPLLVSFIG